MKKLWCLVLLSAAGGCAALAVWGLAIGGAATAATSSRPTAVAGFATQVQRGSSVGTGSQVRSHGARMLPRSQAAPATTSLPRVASAGLSTAAPSLLENFNGTSSRDSEVTNFNQEFEPPDQGFCAGNGFAVDMVNSAYTVYSSSGSTVAGPFNINDVFDEGATQFTSDPRCYYDPTTNTWFATILFISGGDFGASGTTSHLDIAVNSPNGPAVNGHPGDPTNPWIVYQIDTTDPGGNGCPCFGDQPRIGIDSQNVYVTSDEFSISGPQYNGPQIFAFSKADLVALKPMVHYVEFSNLSIGGAQPVAPQPALTTGNPGAEYFLQSLDPNETFDNRIGVWALTNTRAVSSGGTPTLSNVVLTSEPYGAPPNAVQKGTTSRLNSDDDRMQQTQYINGSIWGELSTGVTIPGDSTERTGGAWFRVRPHLTSGKLDSSTKILQQGVVAVSGHYLIYPALQVAPDGGAAMVGTLSGRDMYPSAGISTLAPGASAFGPVHVAAPGTTHYDPTATRWGDYSWAVIDPSGKSIWLATEYIPPKSSQTTDGHANWGTRVMEVSAP
jgi:hypothetical protein